VVKVSGQKYVILCRTQTSATLHLKLVVATWLCWSPPLPVVSEIYMFASGKVCYNCYITVIILYYCYIRKKHWGVLQLLMDSLKVT